MAKKAAVKKKAPAASIQKAPLPLKRQIEPAMVAWLKKKLEGNPIYQQAVADKNIREVYALANEACVGIREVGGNNRGPMVELMQKTIGGANGEAWCMAGQQTCLAFAELVTGVESLIAASELCTAVWAQTSKTRRVQRVPLRGAMAIYQYYVNGKPTINGHAACVRSADQQNFHNVEMNTNSGFDASGNIERDGGGCYLTNRPAKGTPRLRLLGCLIP